MLSKRDAKPNAQPALTPLFGGHDKKPRYLDRDVVTIGRARGCDFILEAPDVSSLHCLIYRSPEGFRLRDCGSRTGTRINGAAVRSHLLADEDVLHVGPFSFQVHLPEGSARPRASGKSRDEVERSRRRLAELALGLRRRCRSLVRSGGRDDLHEREETLRAKIRGYDERANLLEETERELQADRERFLREQEEFRAHVARVEGELAQRLAQAEKDVQERWSAFQNRCGQEQQRLDEWARKLKAETTQRDRQPQAGDAAAPSAAAVSAAAANAEIDVVRRDLELARRGLKSRSDEIEHERQEELKRLEAARRDVAQARQGIRTLGNELDHERAEIDRERSEIARAHDQLQRSREELNKERQEICHMRERWTAEQTESGTLIERQRQAFADAEAALREQRLELSRMMSELRDLQEAIRQQQQVDAPALMQENEQLRQLVADWKERAEQFEQAASQSRAEAAEGDANAAAAVVDDLRNRVTALEQEVGQAAAIRKENEQLRAAVADRDKQLSDLQRRVERLSTPSSAAIDLEAYEAELTRDRQQLESERSRLYAELEQLRQRNGELDEATREMEMELSRERAELSRERTRLDRLRDEVRAEMERMQRDAGVRDSLAPVQKLREELHAKKNLPTPAIRRS